MHQTEKRRFASLTALLPAGMRSPVLTLLSGAVLAQGIAYLARPIQTRLFTPEAFGLLAFFMAAVMVLSAAAGGRLDDALILPEKDEDAAGLFTVAFLLILAVGACCLPLTLWSDPIVGALGRPELARFVGLIPPAIWLAGWSRLAEQWLLRKAAYSSISVRQVVQTVVTTLLQVGAGILGLEAAGLILGTLSGYALAFVLLAVLVIPQLRPLMRVDIRALRGLVVRYRRFPMFAAPSTLLNTASVYLPALLLVFFFDPAVAGYFGLAYGALIIPTSLVGSSMSRAFYVQAAEAHRKGTLPSLSESVLDRLVMLGILPFLGLSIMGPEIFSLVFGDAWREAGIYARLLAPWVFLVFVSSPLSRLFDVLERQHVEFAFNLTLFATRVVALVLGGYFFSPRVAVVLYAGSGFVLWAVQHAWILRLAGVPFRTAAGILGRYLAAGMLPLGLIAVGWMWGSGLVVVALAVAGGALYVWILRRAGLLSVRA